MIRKILHHPRWPQIKKWGGALFLLVVVALLVRYAHSIDWGKVKDSMLELPRAVLLQAFAFAVLSHFVYSMMDLVGRRYTGHHMGKRQVMLVSFICYAFNLNLGSLVGGIGLRSGMYDSKDAGVSASHNNLPRVVERFDRGEFDFVALGRALIADPGWVERARCGAPLLPYEEAMRDVLY